MERQPAEDAAELSRTPVHVLESVRRTIENQEVVDIMT